MKLSKHYGTYNPFGRRSQWHGNPPPCWKMGESFSVQEAKKFNATLEELRELLPKLKSNEPVHKGNM